MSNWNELAQICRRIDFPEEAIVYLGYCYDKIMPIYAGEVQKLAKEWMDINGDWRKCLKNLSTIAESAKVSLNSTRMCFLLYCAVPLQIEYQKRGLPESLYWETLQDLRYKLTECYALYGEWGTFVPEWYRCFYTCERFALGRLQYEPIKFPYKAYKDFLNEGDLVYSCHIPSSGPLKSEDVQKSLNCAYKFYSPSLKNGVLPVVCHSWLLYQPLENVFSESLNILKFRALFDVIANEADEKNGDFWRVFYQNFSTETLSEIPASTRLQENLKEYLLDGKSMGAGFGVLLFDGEKIIN